MFYSCIPTSWRARVYHRNVTHSKFVQGCVPEKAISYHIISYHIISYHIISYHVVTVWSNIQSSLNYIKCTIIYLFFKSFKPVAEAGCLSGRAEKIKKWSTTCVQRHPRGVSSIVSNKSSPQTPCREIIIIIWINRLHFRAFRRRLTSNSYTDGGDGCQVQFGVQYLAQGNFNMQPRGIEPTTFW